MNAAESPEQQERPVQRGNPSDGVPSGRQSVFVAGVFIASVAIFFLALAMRLPSCSESFWLDELHSAWAVSDAFSEVAPRAAVGNQTSGYFHLLWCWRQIFGPGEVAMRMISVLASSFAAAMSVVGVALRSRSLGGGIVSGAILAVDPNGVFFGCELRPYAFVIVFAVLATMSMMACLGHLKMPYRGGVMRHSHGGARWRLAMLFWICVAALVHPTSLGILVGLVPAVLVAAMILGRLKLWKADWVAVIVVVATLAALAMSSLPESWQRRELWRAFGQATAWWQLGYAWSWGAILAVPLAVAGLGVIVKRLDALYPQHNSSSHRNTSAKNHPPRIGWIPGLVGTVGTILFFVASYYEWVPLWHRRYFIAALPLLAWTAGEWVASGCRSISAVMTGRSVFRLGEAWGRALVETTMVFLVILVLLFQQGTLASFQRGEIPLQLRREHWREAVAAVDDSIESGDRVWLDSGLIEASYLYYPTDRSSSISELQQQYLRFPLQGPYTLVVDEIVSCAEHPSWTQQRMERMSNEGATVWLITRSFSNLVERYLKRLEQYRTVDAEIVQTGTPKVVKIQFPVTD